MKTILMIYKNNRPFYWAKYTLYLDDRSVMITTNSKEEIKIILDLCGMKMVHFHGIGGNYYNVNRYYVCFYN